MHVGLHIRLTPFLSACGRTVGWSPLMDFPRFVLMFWTWINLVGWGRRTILAPRTKFKLAPPIRVAFGARRLIWWSVVPASLLLRRLSSPALHKAQRVVPSPVWGGNNAVKFVHILGPLQHFALVPHGQALGLASLTRPTIPPGSSSLHGHLAFGSPAASLLRSTWC